MKVFTTHIVIPWGNTFFPQNLQQGRPRGANPVGTTASGTRLAGVLFTFDTHSRGGLAGCFHWPHVTRLDLRAPRKRLPASLKELDGLAYTSRQSLVTPLNTRRRPRTEAGRGRAGVVDGTPNMLVNNPRPSLSPLNTLADETFSPFRRRTGPGMHSCGTAHGAGAATNDGTAWTTSPPAPASGPDPHGKSSPKAEGRVSDHFFLPLARLGDFAPRERFGEAAAL